MNSENIKLILNPASPDQNYPLKGKWNIKEKTVGCLLKVRKES